MRNQEIDIGLARKLSELIDLPEGVVLKHINLHCKDCIHEELCKDRLSKQGYSMYANRSLIVEDCEHFKNKAEIAEIIIERDKAIEFIKYLDKNYSSYMTEDEKFEEWRK